MKNCEECGKETTGYASNVFTNKERPLCPDCWDKSQTEIGKIIITTFGVSFVILILLVIIQLTSH